MIGNNVQSIKSPNYQFKLLHQSSYYTKDRKLSTVVQYLQKGWPADCPEDELKPYFSRKVELSLYVPFDMQNYIMGTPRSLLA